MVRASKSPDAPAARNDKAAVGFTCSGAGRPSRGGGATGAADATVKLWDLRKTKNFHTITPAAGGTISSVQFDYTGQFLTVGSNDVR